MAQPKDFLYFLTDASGRSYRVKNGLVEAVSTPAPLRVTPDGWQEKSIRYKRNIRLSGLFRTFTNPLKFVKDGALILRNRFYTYGSEDKIYLVIHRLDKTYNGGWVYRLFYRGELDLSQWDDQDNYVETNVMEGDLSKLLNANENTTYELDIDVPEAVTIKMDGTVLQGSRNWLIPETALTGEIGAGHWVPISFVNGELTNLGIIGGSQSPADPNSYFILAPENNMEFPLIGEVKVKVNSAVQALTVRLIKRLANNTIQTLQTDTRNPPNADEWYTFSYDYPSLVLNVDEELYLQTAAVPGPGGPAGVRVDYGESTFTSTFQYRYRTTFIKALRPLYVAQKLLDKITGGGYTVTSDYLSTVWENLLITSGDGIRSIPDTNPKLKTSWNDFFNSYNVPCNLSAGIRNGQLYIEKLEDAFQPTIQQVLTSAKKMNPKTAKDYQYNTVKIGYPDPDTEDVNGRREFNVTQIYTSPITRVKRELDLVSKYLASMYAIELTRVNLEGKDTTDSANDNRVFFLHVEKTPTAGTGTEPAAYYKLLRETFTSISGIISPATAFNIGISPKRCLLAHGNFLRSVFWKQEAGYLTFQTSDKNAELVTVKDGVTISEKGNVQIGNLPAPLFIPLELKFESPMANDITTTMDAGPDGTFAVPYDGSMLYGFPMEVGIQPANRPAQETILLCSPQTDLTKLITYGR